MKKVLFTMMAALLVCGMSFAQPKANRTLGPVAQNLTQETSRDAWVGELDTHYIYTMEAGDMVLMDPTKFDGYIDGTLTKFKFYRYTHDNYPEYVGTSFTFQIYENVELSGDYASYGFYDPSTVGTPVYTQDVTVSENGMAEIELTTPYTCNGNFMVALVSNEKSMVLQSGTDSSVENGQYTTYYYEDLAQNFLIVPVYNDGTFYVFFSVYIEDGTGYEASWDLEPMFLNQSFNAEITEVGIGETDDLKFLPYIANNGPDEVPSTENVYLSVVLKVNGEQYDVIEPEEGPLGFDLPVNNGIVLAGAADNYSITISNAELMEMIGDATDFTIELTAIAENDLVTDNNTAVLLVTVAHLFPAQNVVATKETSSVVITWDAPEPGTGTLNGYKIYRNGAQIGMKQAGVTTHTDNTNLADGTYTYCVEAVYSEGNAEWACYDLVIDGISSNDAESIAVYPNPATTAVKVVNAEGANIRLINSLGQVVANIEAAQAMQEINVEGLAEGIYTIRIANENSVVTKQFCVRK